MKAAIMSFVRGATILLFALLAACTTDVEPLTPAQRQAVAAFVSTFPPSPQRRLEVDFGGKLKLLGYDLGREPWRSGETIRVTWHWQTLKPLGKGWRLVTQIGDGARTIEQDGNSSLRWLYGPDRWRLGEYVRDTQELYLPDDWAGDTAKLFLSVRRGDERLPVSGDRSDEQGRLLAATIQTTPSKAALVGEDAVPYVSVVQTKRSPRLDGSLEDPVWSFARTTRAFVETREGGPASLQASAKLLWDSRYLYVGVVVQDALLRATHREHDEHLWEQDCIELMLDPNGDGKDYFEIQVSPRGTVFDTRYDSRRVPRPFGHVDWDSRVRVAVSARGELDDKERDAGYTVEIAVPWQAFSLDQKAAAPPAIGDEWRANLYVMDLLDDRQQAAAWSSLGIGDFHVPRRFGILAFEGQPEGMVGIHEPLQISDDRAPAPLKRGPGVGPAARERMIQRRAGSRRNPGDPLTAPSPETPQNLEPAEAPQ